MTISHPMRRKHFAAILLLPLMLACSDTGTEDQALERTQRENEQYDLVISEKLGDSYTALPSSTVSEQYAKVKLGHVLYYDTRLSKEGNNSCNSCHNLSKFGVDQLSFSPGDAGKLGGRNSPTVLNAALHSFQFWDGRAKDVEEQAGMPILNPIEMAIPSKEFLMKRLSETELYPSMFKAAFPSDPAPLTYANLQKAIGAFERTLITPSRFDKYLAGDKTALTVQEKKGLVTFFNVGCNTCHNGTLFGGNQFQKFGVHDDYWKYTGSKVIDKGVFDLTKDETKMYVFKVPTLRNVEHTYPYFHDGSVKDLKEAVKIMATTQLKYDLSDSEAEKLVAFLKALTGEVPAFAQTTPTVLQ
jgi:cytochrome c peroxidase